MQRTEPVPDTGYETALTIADTVDPTIRRRLDTSAGLGATVVLAAAIGATTAGGLWASTNGLREQAEDTARQMAVTAATAFATLAEPSAANVARTLDMVLDDQLRAQAAAAAMLVDAAESAGHGSDYIQDALRQIGWRSPIRRIDVTAQDGPPYSTEAAPLTTGELEPAFAALALADPEGRTAATSARQTATGLTKAAAAQLARRAVVRLEQELDSLAVAETYGGTDDRPAKRLADGHAATIARLTTHAIELAEDAGWGRGRIERRLRDVVDSTAIERVTATGADNRVVYHAGAGAARNGPDGDEERDARPPLGQDSRARALPGRYDEQRRWIAIATATRANGRLRATVEVATRAGEGSLVESAWQSEANRLAGVEGITGVWVTRTEGERLRLAAAAPGPGRSRAATDAWERWDDARRRMAARAATTGNAQSRASIRPLGRGTATVLGAAPGGRDGGTGAIAVVMETRADAVVQRMRRHAGAGLSAAAVLVALLLVATTWGTRRWLTRPVEAVAAAARCLQAGERPPAGLTTDLCLRKDEIGGLARTFDQMCEHVLARHQDLSVLVADRTRWLREANDNLTAAQEKVKRELGLAKTVQEALVPGGTVRAGSLTLSSRMTAARELGGDFVNIQHRGRGELFVAVCDVSGKGVAAALFMAVAQAALAAAAASHRDVRDIAADANRRLCTANPLGMFVTAWIATIDTTTGTLEYACAGHEPPVGIAADGTLRKLETTSAIPFGLEAAERYGKRVHEMRRHETILAYTDGITDACNPAEEPFGEQRLLDLAIEARGEPPERILTRIWTAIDLFSGPMPATDDKTCMVIRRAQPDSTPSTNPRAPEPAVHALPNCERPAPARSAAPAPTPER